MGTGDDTGPGLAFGHFLAVEMPRNPVLIVPISATVVTTVRRMTILA